MANFYKDIQLPNQNIGNIMTLNNSHVLESTNIPVSNLINVMNEVANHTNSISNINNSMNASTHNITNLTNRVANIETE